ncbi:MAG: hypothetical protein WA130_12780 [Candidatus Methanoperedens sp.]
MILLSIVLEIGMEKIWTGSTGFAGSTKSYPVDPVNPVINDYVPFLCHAIY